MANRRRPIPKRIWFTEEEWHLVEAKMVEAEMTNFSAFGLEMLLDNGGNMILSEGLVLQEEECWKDFLQGDVLPRNNHSELYFEEAEIESFVDKLERLYPETEYVNPLTTHSWGQKVIRFYDLDGNLIEVGTPA